jgi:Lrp/AsnC family leucine-responsive transcriptional regulator
VAASLEATDWAVITQLQRDGRITISELARRINLGATATAERIKRLEADGVITGYQARIDLAKIGLPVLAIVRLQYTRSRHAPLHQLVEQRAEILECQRVTGENCYILKIAAETTNHLEKLVSELTTFGQTTTNLVYSETLPYRVPRAVDDQDHPTAMSLKAL